MHINKAIEIKADNNTPNGLTRHATVELSYTHQKISIHRGTKNTWDTFKLTPRNMDRLSRFTPHAVWVFEASVQMNIYPR